MTTCWIITEGIKGTENQCLGVAEALGLLPVIKRIGLRQPWRALSPYLGMEQPWGFTGDPLTPPWPDILLASGRKSIAPSRYIRKVSGGKTFTVQIQDPRISPRHFDLVTVPAHDPTRGANVVVTHAAPNRITPQRIDDARHDFAALFSSLPAPRVAVLIGGNSRAYTMTAEMMKPLAAQLRALAMEQGMGLMVTASRRTPPACLALLHESLSGTTAYIWDGTGPNPYFGFLAWADYVVVTADSVSMISEAATAGKPIYVAPLEGGTARFKSFHETLLAQGIVRPFTGVLEPYAYTPLADAAHVAAEIRARCGKTLYPGQIGN